MTNGTINFCLLGVDKWGREIWAAKRRGLSFRLNVQDSGWTIGVRPVDQPGPHSPILAPEGLSLVGAMRYCEEHTNEQLLDLGEDDGQTTDPDYSV